MRPRLLLSTVSILSVVIVSALDLDSDLTSPSATTDSLLQDTGLPLDQGEELSVTQPTSLFDQAKLSEGSEVDPVEASGLTSLPLDPNESSNDPPDSFLNQPTSLFDVTTLPEGSESNLNDGSASLFGANVNGENDKVNLSSLSDHTLFDDTFEMAECETSKSLPVIGKKSRLRRLDDSRSCKIPTTTPPTGVDPPLGGADDEPVKILDLMTRLNDPYFLMKYTAARQNRDHNSYCYLFTEGILPWGVCSSGNPEDQLTINDQLHVVTIGFFNAYDLDHCTLGTFSHPHIYLHIQPAIY